MRTNLPNTIVNIMGVFKGKLFCHDFLPCDSTYRSPIVSGIYSLTKGERYCQTLGLPHYNIECACALLGGAIGQHTRDLMDELMDQYSTHSRSFRSPLKLISVVDDRLVQIITEYQTANYPDFAVLWFPANIPLSSYPIKGE
jgi:phospholipase B1, membrane-associated